MRGVHQSHHDGGIDNDFVDFRDLDDDVGSIGEINHGVVKIVLEDDGRDEQADAHEHLVLDEQVVVFRGGLPDEDVHGFQHDETCQEIEQYAHDEKGERGDALG